MIDMAEVGIHAMMVLGFILAGGMVCLVGMIVGRMRCVAIGYGMLAVGYVVAVLKMVVGAIWIAVM